MDVAAAVVLGADTAGAAAALLLARAGVRTTLLDPAGAAPHTGGQVPPGLCLGPRGPLGDVLRRAGAEGAIDLRLDPLTRLLPSRLGLEALGAARLLAYASAARDADLLAWAERPLAALQGAAGLSPRAAALLSTLVALPFAPPEAAPTAGEALSALRDLAWAGGVARPPGGAAAIARALAGLAAARGAVIRAGERPHRVLVDGDRAQGVALTGGAILPAGIVVSALGVPATLQLVGEDLAEPAHPGWALLRRGLRPGRAALELRLGLRSLASTPVRGLYLAGDPGVGIDLAASSAAACVERVLADLGIDPGCPPPPSARAAARALARRGLAAAVARLTLPRWYCVP